MVNTKCCDCGYNIKPTKDTYWKMIHYVDGKEKEIVYHCQEECY